MKIRWLKNPSMRYNPYGTYHQIHLCNWREQTVYEHLHKKGWNALHRGWPDFLFYRKRKGIYELFFVEVKRVPKRNPRFRGLSSQQWLMSRILRQVGRYRIARI